MEFNSTKTFLNEDFLLQNKISKLLYHEFAAKMPIIDYHNHLSPDILLKDIPFKNINAAWLDGDHYKWRVMRSLGIDENEITGNASDELKFKRWAQTVPYCVRNPLFHWTHLELKRYFEIDLLLQPSTAGEIFNKTNEMITKIRPSKIMKMFDVEVLCTTDDPTSDLKSHISLSKENKNLKVMPGFRPDNVVNISNLNYVNYIESLGKISNIEINSYKLLLESLENRIDFFDRNGCIISDHGLESMYCEDYNISEIEEIFKLRLSGKILNQKQVLKFKSSILFDLCSIYYQKGWTQQFHLGAIRNNNSLLMKKIGYDAGCDSIGDFSQAKSMSDFFNRLNNEDQLTNTIVYNLNPSMNKVFASMIGNFSSSKVSMQFGTAWWYLDQKDGIEEHISTLSNLGLLSKFIGMLTDSRSFLSFPRHEYFRRILCNIIGKDIDEGLLPSDINFFGKIVQNICYYNAKNFFKL